MLVAALLVLVGRLVGHGIAALERYLAARLPKVIALIITFALGAAIFSTLVNDVVIDSFFGWANRSFGTFDDETPPGIVQPTSALRSGGPGSLVPWNTLGYEGRNFAGGGPTVAELQSFAGPDEPVLEPIRVYSGLKSAPDTASRAALAVEELERTGAFDRDVLVVATVTGTGWVDPVAARAIETMHHGNTAIVAQQYSYLPSWISFLVDSDKAAETGAALNEAVYQRWSQLPENDRPKLIVFGLSLGSYGAEAGFAGADIGRVSGQPRRSQRRRPAHGANGDRTRSGGSCSDARAPGSPVWAPVYDNGVSVRSVNDSSDVTPPDPAWRQPRVLYIHHPSDPVGTFNISTLWSRPDWTRAPPRRRRTGPRHLVPDHHRGAGGRRPGGRLQRPVGTRPQLRRERRRRLGGRGAARRVDGRRQRPPPAVPRTGVSAPASRRTTAALALTIAALAGFNVARSTVLPDGWDLGANIAMAGVVALVAAWAAESADELGLARSRIWRGLAWGAGAFAVVLGVLLVAAAIPATRGFFDDDRADIGAGQLLFEVGVSVPFGTVLLEELAFRGSLLALLRRLTRTWVAVVVSSLLFGLWHIAPAITSAGSNDAVADAGIGVAAASSAPCSLRQSPAWCSAGCACARAACWRRCSPTWAPTASPSPRRGSSRAEAGGRAAEVRGQLHAARPPADARDCKVRRRHPRLGGRHWSRAPARQGGSRWPAAFPNHARTSHERPWTRARRSSRPARASCRSRRGWCSTT